MFEYRQVLTRMRLGDTDRAIARVGLMGRRKVAQLRRTGEAAQVDFGKGPEVLDPRTGELLSTWIFVMTLAWSRHAYAEVVTDQKVATWLGCHRRAFEWFNGVPRRLVAIPACAESGDLDSRGVPCGTHVPHKVFILNKLPPH